MNYRELLKQKSKIVVKIGSSSLTHESTGQINFSKLEKFVRDISNLKNMGKDVIIVSSGAIAVGTKELNLKERPSSIAMKQAVSAVGQSTLMMIYQKLFSEYNQIVAQILLTKDVLDHPDRKINALNTLNALLEMGAIPIVNENDTVATEEIEFGDNDTLSAIVAEIISSDLLILLSDIDGLYDKDPRNNNDAKLLSQVDEITQDIEDMGGGSGSLVGTGGMATKISAAKIAIRNGIDMVIANSSYDHIIEKIIAGEEIGTLFIGKK